MIEKIYTEEMQQFSKHMLLLKEDVISFEKSINKSSIYQKMNKIVDLVTTIFGVLFLTIEQIYNKVRYNEPFFIKERIISVKRQKLEFIGGLISLILIIGISIYSIPLGLMLVVLYFLGMILPIALLEMIKKIHCSNYERIRNKKYPFNQMKEVNKFKITQEQFCWLYFPKKYMEIYDLKTTKSKLIVYENLFKHHNEGLVRNYLNRVKSKYFLFLPDNSVLLLLDFSQISNENANEFLNIIDEIKNTIESFEKEGVYLSEYLSEIFRMVDQIIEERIKSLMHSVSLKEMLNEKGINERKRKTKKI